MTIAAENIIASNEQEALERVAREYQARGYRLALEPQV